MQEKSLHVKIDRNTLLDSIWRESAGKRSSGESSQFMGRGREIENSPQKRESSSQVWEDKHDLVVK